MFIVQRQYVKSFLRLFILLSLGLSATFALIGLIERLDEFLPFKPSPWMLAKYSLMTLPGYLSYLFPMSALLSGLFVFAQAVKSRETVAVLASGGSLRRLLMPFVLIGALLSAVSFMLSEFVVPQASAEAKKNIQSIKKQTALSFFVQGAVWLKAKDGSIVKMRLYGDDLRSAHGVSIFVLGEEGISRRIEAREAVFEGLWKLRGVREYDLALGTVAESAEMPFPHLAPPEFFEDDVKRPDEMGFRELREYLQRLKDAGLRNQKLTVDMNSKVSYPFVNLFMLVLGISLAVRREMGGFVSTALGIFVSLLYWFGYTMALSMGYAGIMPPQAAAWAMPALFGSIAFYLYLKMPE